MTKTKKESEKEAGRRERGVKAHTRRIEAKIPTLRDLLYKLNYEAHGYKVAVVNKRLLTSGFMEAKPHNLRNSWKPPSTALASTRNPNWWKSQNFLKPAEPSPSQLKQSLSL